MEAHDQITGPPASDAIGYRDWPVIDQTRKICLVIRAQLGGTAKRRAIDGAVVPQSLEPDDLSPQCLAIYPAGFGCHLSRGAINHRRNRQELARLPDHPVRAACPLSWLAAPIDEALRSCNPTAQEVFVPWQKASVCRGNSLSGLFGKPQQVSQSAGWYNSFSAGRIPTGKHTTRGHA